MKRITKARQEAARLLAAGKNLTETAQTLGVHEETVLEWMNDPDVMDLFRRRLMQNQTEHYARAVERIGEMMEDDNAAVAHRAAKEALSKFERTVFWEDEDARPQEIQVIVKGMPEIGMPEE